MAGLSISRAWDETKQVIARDGSLLTTIALALLVLPGIVSELGAPEAPPGQLPEPGPWLIVAAIAVLIGIAGQLAIVHIALGSRSTVGEAILHGARRAPIYIGASLLWATPFAIAFYTMIQGMTPEKPSPAIGLALLILLPALFFFLVRLVVTAAVVTAEEGGPLRILGRSWDLTRGHWWRLFAFLILLLIAGTVIVVVVGMVAGVLARIVSGEVEPMSIGALIVALFTQAAGAAITVVFVVMLARIYAQLAGAEVGVPNTGT